MAVGRSGSVPSGNATAGAVPRLHVITPDTPDMADPSLMDVVTTIVRAGAPLVQARCKSGSDVERHRFVTEVQRRCAEAGARCLVNDRVDLALAVGAAGVHLGADDLPVDVARRLLGADAIVGGTCRDPDDARRAEATGATYVGCGPVYRSTTKTAGLPDPMGPAGIERIAAAVSIPVIAIAGVALGHVPELLDAGAHGVAVVAAVFGADDPAAATIAFLEALAGAAPLDAPRLPAVGAPT